MEYPVRYPISFRLVLLRYLTSYNYIKYLNFTNYSTIFIKFFIYFIKYYIAVSYYLLLLLRRGIRLPI